MNDPLDFLAFDNSCEYAAMNESLAYSARFAAYLVSPETIDVLSVQEAFTRCYETWESALDRRERMLKRYYLSEILERIQDGLRNVADDLDVEDLYIEGREHLITITAGQPVDPMYYPQDIGG